MPDNHFISLPVEGGGSGTTSPLTTKGDLWGFSSVNARLPIGTDGQVLMADAASTLGLKWATASGTVTTVNTDSSTSSIFANTANVIGTTTVTMTLSTQAANKVLAGPTTGAAAAPTFRSLVGADLPNPSSSTLGGVQSAAAQSHKWIASISTSGVPSLTQPAFSDISGSVDPSQLPNPTTSTLGGVEAIVAVTSNWIRSISTSGVPALSQPAFSDISGNIATSQMNSGTSASSSTFWRGDGTWVAPTVSLTYGTDIHWVTNSAGFGSTGTKIVRWTTVTQAVTSNGDITYAANTGNNGDSWTINNSGVYSMFLCLSDTTTINQIGISRNASSLTTNFSALAITQQLGISNTGTTWELGFGVTAYLAAGDVIRVHCNGQATLRTGETNGREQFWIRRLI